MQRFSLPRGYGDEYRQTLRLAIPVVLTQLGQVTVQLADNLMVGRLGAVPLAAVSFGTAVFFLFFIAGIGLSMGLTPLVGKAYAQGKHRLSAAYLQNGLLIFFVAGLLLLGIMLGIVPLFKHMGQDAEVVEMATGFYTYLAWSTVPFMIFAGFKQFLEGVGVTRIEMNIVLTANVINIILNYILIYGKLGAPAMGPAGSGLATLIARIFMAVAMVAYFCSKERFRRYLNMFRPENINPRYIAMVLGVGAPIAMQMLMEFTAFSSTSVMMGWLGPVPLAGNQIAITLVNCTFMVVIGLSAATTIRVSHEFGRGNLRGIRRVANSSYHIAFGYAIFAALLFISLRGIIPHFFTPDPAVMAVTAQLLILAGIFQISDTTQNISVGILRGMQDVKYVMKVAFISYVMVNIPTSYCLAFVLGLGPAGLWAGFIVSLTLASVLLNARFRRLYKKLRRAER